tara:strand:- start:207 stop:542 length:336 start_codon:yes stop_codon:yes gene_type:complete
MTKKQIFNVETNTSTMVDLTTEEQTVFDNATTAHSNDEINRRLKELRYQRNKLLVETDYLALPDVTMSSDMTTYRQALRDITNGLDTVAKVNTKLEIEDGKYKNFPTKPGA